MELAISGTSAATYKVMEPHSVKMVRFLNVQSWTLGQDFTRLGDCFESPGTAGMGSDLGKVCGQFRNRHYLQRGCVSSQVDGRLREISIPTSFNRYISDFGSYLLGI